MTVALSAGLALACGGAGFPGGNEAEEVAAILAVDPPAPPGSFAPSLVADGDGALLTWWERLPAPEGERHHRLMFSRYDVEWSAPTVVSEGEEYFANWADVPSVIREPSGSLLAHWLAKTGSETYAYSIYLSRSGDEGATWEVLGKLNDDTTDTEHGFVSMVREGDAVRAYWLDGRQMADGGPMSVRSALVTDTIGASDLLDDRVCECCPTDAVAMENGSLVVFRNRSEDEVREMHVVRHADGEWGESVPVSSDGWMIPGCPVNGPAIDAAGDRVAVAWFTGREGAPRVTVAFSSDLEAGVDASAVVDDATPLGRVGLVLDENAEALVSWLAVDGVEADLTLRRVAADGSMGEPLVVGRTSAGRSSGVPELVRVGDRLLVAWVEVMEGADPVLRMRQLPSAAVPPVVSSK